MSLPPPPVLAYCSEALQIALNRLAQIFVDSEPGDPGTVFLLGAGCSMQYGLPGFQQLLAGLCEDLYRKQDNWSGKDVATLRARLEADFRKPTRKLREALARRLGNVRGADCPGYRRLARLMRCGWVGRTVTMNFDTLLDEGCIAEGLSSLPITKVHGSITNDPYGPVLDIKNSEFFLAAKEHWRNQLTTNHVVVLGYSGIDTKMSELLKPTRNRAKDCPDLFYVGIEAPTPLLDDAIVARGSRELRIVDPEAGTFENFMQALEATLDYYAESQALPLPVRRRAQGTAAHLTPPEVKALAACFAIAQRLRATLSVPASETDLVDYSHDLFTRCLGLASEARLRLTSAEKYLLHCAAFFHDLGFLLAYGRDKRRLHAGWELLHRRGELTGTLLEQHRPMLREELLPESYAKESAAKLTGMLMALCRRHIEVDGGADSTAIASDVEFSATTDTVLQGRYGVTVRFQLLLGLLTAADELSTGHRFLPAGDPLDPRNTPDFVIDDPILDLYLRRKDETIRFELHDGIVAVGAAKSKAGHPARPALAEWLTVRAKRAVEELNATAVAYGGDALRFDDDTLAPQVMVKCDLVPAALAEALALRLDLESVVAPGAAHRILDLLALYVLEPVNPGARLVEPRARMNSPAVAKALEMLAACGDRPHEGLLTIYVPMLAQGALGDTEKRFCDDVRSIYLPAWSLCANIWRQGSMPAVSSCATLDLGSTLHRSEVAYGLRALPINRPPSNGSGELACGHDGCTLCTGRLLYALTYERLLRHGLQGDIGDSDLHTRRPEVDFQREGQLPAIVRYLLEKKDAQVWWGIESEVTSARRGDSVAIEHGTSERYGVQAANFLTSALRGIAFLLWVDSRSGDHDRDMGSRIDRRGLAAVFRTLWQALCEAGPDRLLDRHCEDAHSYILGEMARTYLLLQRLRDSPEGDLLGGEGRLQSARENLAAAVEALALGHGSLIDQFNLLPAYAFLHGGAVDDRERERWCTALLETYQGFSRTFLWISKGPKAGSWGYNDENTARFALVFTSFWRYVFDHRDAFEGRLKSLTEAS